MKRRVQVQVTMQKIIPHVDQRYRAPWEIPEEHQSIGLIACDHEEVMWLALDDGTKKAKIAVAHAEKVYGGGRYNWSNYGGEITAVISGENVSDVRSGLFYIREYIEKKAALYMFNEENTLGYYADWVPRTGKYLQKRLGLAEGEAIAYLSGTPVESTYALDKALKASNTRLAEVFAPPTRVNTGGGIVAGTESACRSAVEAFAEAVEYCAGHPMEVE